MSVSFSNSLEAYTAAQRERLEQLRKATQREEALLSGRTVSAVDVVVASPPRRMDAHDERKLDARRSSEKLAQESAALDAEEKRVESRIAKAEDAKRELLAKLIALQYREQDLKNRSQMLEEDEASFRLQQDDTRNRMREVSHQTQLIETDIAERQAKHAVAKKRLEERQLEQSKVVQRLKQQLHEQEDRIRTLEWQLTSKVRACDEQERELRRQEVSLRDAEISAIEELRSDIQRTRAVLGL